MKLELRIESVMYIAEIDSTLIDAERNVYYSHGTGELISLNEDGETCSVVFC